MDDQCIREVLKYAKMMHEANLVNAYEGNISTIKDGLIYITPSQMSKKELTEAQICVMDAASDKQVGGTCKVSSEYLLHANAYKMRPDIVAVVHCHSPYLTAHAITGQAVTTRAYPEMMFLFGEIPVVPYGRPGTSDIYKHMPEHIKDHDVVLLSNHGAVAVGSSIMDAMNKLETAEACTRVLDLAKTLGMPRDLPDEECAVLYRGH